ncbi:MAG: hypothetical protein AB7N54_00090 [Alphaproteobacteria bacterium]
MESLIRLLLRLSEGGEPAQLWGRLIEPYPATVLDGLLSSGVLTEQAPATEWDCCPDCECGADARPVERLGGRLVATCPMDRRSDVVLDELALRSFRISSMALVREIARAGGLTGEPSEPLPGIWHLGHIASDREVFLALARSAAMQPGLVAALRADHPQRPITLIAPPLTAADRMAFAGTGIWITSRDECIRDGECGGVVVDLASLDPQPAAVPRLIIQRSALRITLDGTERQVPRQPFNLLFLLAEALFAGKPAVTVPEIEKKFSGRRAADLVRDLRSHMGNRGLIRSQKSPSAYFLTLARHEVELRA